MKRLTVIIPFFDSREILHYYLPEILSRLENRDVVEVILVDATQQAENVEFCDRLNVICIQTSRACRAHQMNLGAEKVHTEWMFFLHIDSIPPEKFDTLILKSKAEAGCFQLKFDWGHWFLKVFSFFTRFYWAVARGGDQGLFIRTGIFQEMGGFEEIEIMEDIEMCRRLMRNKRFKILPERITTSARKYREQGVYRLQWIFTQITLLYWMGISTRRLKKIYVKNIR